MEGKLVTSDHVKIKKDEITRKNIKGRRVGREDWELSIGWFWALN